MDYVIYEDSILFNNYFNNELDEKIINDIKKVSIIIFGNNFNKNVDLLPNNVKYIKFGFCFNKTVDNLPMSVETLIFGNSFNQKIDFLPCSIKKLKLGSSFCYDLINLPSSIEKLEIGENYKGSLHYIGPNVKYLCLGRYTIRILDWDYDGKISELLKNNYKKLKMSNNRYIFELFPIIPKTVKTVGFKIWGKKIMLDIG